MQFLVVLHRRKKNFEWLLTIFFRESYSKSLVHVEKQFQKFWDFFFMYYFLVTACQVLLYVSVILRSGCTLLYAILPIFVWRFHSNPSRALIPTTSCSSMQLLVIGYPYYQQKCKIYRYFTYVSVILWSGCTLLYAILPIVVWRSQSNPPRALIPTTSGSSMQLLVIGYPYYQFLVLDRGRHWTSFKG